MEILNGYGTIDIITGKYMINKKDRIESKKLIRKFEKVVSQILEKKFGSVIKNDEVPTSYNKFTEQSSSYLWTPVININTSNALTNRGAMVSVNTGINSNGYDGKIVKRHIVISFELKGLMRPKFHKNWDEGTLLKTYILNDNWNETITEFKFWLNTKYDMFIEQNS